MPTEHITVKGNNIEDLLQEITKQKLENPRDYIVVFYEGDDIAGQAGSVHGSYDSAFLSAVDNLRSRCSDASDFRQYRMEVTATAERRVEESTPAGAGPRENRTTTYTDVF